MTEEKISVLIVEDHFLARIGIRALLERYSDISIIGEAADGASAISIAQDLNPKVILMDIGLPGINGIETAIEIKKIGGHIRIVMFSANDNEEFVFAALSAGAEGYCLKDTAAEQIVSAIRTANAGGVWIDRQIAQKILAYMSVKKIEQTKAEPISKGKFNLSGKELRILSLVVEGLSNIEMADHLGISPETVKSHLRNIMQKLSVSDRTQAAVKAVREGLLS